MGNIKLNMNGNYMENDKIDLLSNQKKEKKQQSLEKQTLKREKDKSAHYQLNINNQNGNVKGNKVLIKSKSYKLEPKFDFVYLQH